MLRCQLLLCSWERFMWPATSAENAINRCRKTFFFFYCKQSYVQRICFSQLVSSETTQKTPSSASNRSSPVRTYFYSFGHSGQSQRETPLFVCRFPYTFAPSKDHSVFTAMYQCQLPEQALLKAVKKKIK